MKRNPDLGHWGISRKLSGDVGVFWMCLKSSAPPSIRIFSNREDAASRCDILAPHGVLDALRRCRSAFTLGRQHDAAEALTFIVDTTGVDAALFRRREVLI